MSITYISITFTGYHWQQNPVEYTTHGWWVVGIIAFNVAVNLIVVLSEIYRGIRKWVRWCLYKYMKTPPPKQVKQ